MTKKAGTERLRQQNRQAVLETLTSGRSLASIEIGKRTGLSQATISGITKDLLEEEIISNDAEESARHRQVQRGRPMVKLRLRGDAALIITVRIVFQQLDFTAIDFAQNVLHRQSYKVTNREFDTEKLGQSLVAQTHVFLKDANVDGGKITLIHAACQGTVDGTKGILKNSPAFTDTNLDIRTPLETAFNCTCLVSNDVNMMATGLEADFHQNRKSNTSQSNQTGNRNNEAIAVIYAGRGVGMGLFVHGELFEGLDGAASEFGHILHEKNGDLCRCGLKGCIEAYASDYAVLRRVNAITDIENAAMNLDHSQLDEIADSARANNADAIAAFNAAGAALGRGINTIVTLLRPSKIYLCGPFAYMPDLIENPLAENLYSDRVKREDVAIELLTEQPRVLVENGAARAAHSYLISKILTDRQPVPEPAPKRPVWEMNS